MRSPARTWRLRGTAITALLSAAGCGTRDAAIGRWEGPVMPPPAPVASPAAAVESRPVDLVTVLRLAADVHLDIRESRARVREAEGRADAADGGLVPALSLGGGTGGVHGTVQGSFGNIQDVDFRSVNALGSVSLSLNVGESIYRDLAAHRLQDAARGLDAATRLRTLLVVTGQYLDLVEADATVRVREQLVTESRALLQLARAREIPGVGSALDTERASARLAAAELDLLTSRNGRQQRSKSLAASLRLDATVDLVPIDRDVAPATLLDPSEPLEAWMERAKERRPEGSALMEARDASVQEAQAERWGTFGPQLSAVGAVGGTGTNFGNVGDRESWAVFLGWTLSAGALGRIQAADARTEQANIGVERFHDHLRAAVAAAFEEVRLSREELEPAERELRSAEHALTLSRASFAGGLLPEIDVLLAQQAADRARLRRLAAVVRHNKAQVQLLAEAGLDLAESLSGDKVPRTIPR